MIEPAETHKQRGLIRIGTSGMVLPGNKLTFPQEFRTGTRLHYYGSLFNTLVLNSSFYKIPLASTFTKWSVDVPENFKFTLKLWKGITHAKKLLFDLTDIERFMHAADKLHHKKGFLLIQFPASISFHYAPEVESIFQRVQQINKNEQWKIAIEVRNASWYQDKAYYLLEKYKMSLVIHDMPGSTTPIEYLSTDSIYCRFHGPKGDYRGSYTDDFICRQAKQYKEWSVQGKDIYIYFNNTMEGALENAQLLQKYMCD